MKTRDKDLQHINTTLQPPTPDTHHEEQRRQFGFYLLLLLIWIVGNYAILDSFPMIWRDTHYLGFYVIGQLFMIIGFISHCQQETSDAKKPSVFSTAIDVIEDILNTIYK